IDRFYFKPTISIIMPVHNPRREYLESAVNSVRKQLYSNWELCICDDGSTQPDIRAFLQECSRNDPRVRVSLSERRGGISAASNIALQMATGDFVGFLDHDDEL